MRSILRAMLTAAMLLACESIFAAQFYVGIRIGPPPPPVAVRILPPRPGPEFVWIEGYWYPAGRHYRWHDGYWTRPPYMARWIMPRYDSGMYFAGYWESNRGWIEHNHRWDRNRDRDFRRSYHYYSQDHRR